MPFLKVWPSQDAFINSPSGGTGGTSPIKSGEAGGVNFVGFLQFALSAIPSNATITSAALYLASAESASGFDHTFHRMVRTWVEAELTWLIASTGVNWGTSGAANTTTDYNSSSLGTMTHPASGVFDSLDITSTVQNWIDGTNSNYGLRISSATATQDDWHSREGATKALWPYLEIDYTIPALTYSINGTAIEGGVLVSWPVIPIGLKANGARRHSPWIQHRWSIPETTVASYQTLIALRGTSFVSLVSNDYTGRNVTRTYTTGRVVRVSGRPLGHKVTNVTVDFLVKES